MASSRIEEPLSDLLEILSDLSGSPARAVQRHGPDGRSGLLVEISGEIFELAWVELPTPGKVHEVAKGLVGTTGGLPLLASPFMPPSCQAVLERLGVSWLDASGNARIAAPGLRLYAVGRPNRFRRPGRPPNVFAPKSARVARWMLTHPNERFSQREIARGTGLSEGYVSRIVARLVDGAFLERGTDGTLQTKNPGLMLDAWREAYDFSRHSIIRGHVAARSGEALATSVAQALSEARVGYAATGLVAAWQMTHFAAFRTATFYVESHLARSALAPLGFHEDDRGSNLWLVVPNDRGVFQDAKQIGGIRCVSPVQAFLDLKDQPERSQEAASHLRVELFPWSGA